ncbi:MAG: hypothetical protein AAB441_01335 [Patescibacteria group bacterium]
MSITNKILLTALVVVVIFFGFNEFKKTSKQINTTDSPANQEKNSKSQENEGGNVTVTAEPKALKMGEKPAFKIEFNTHSVDLSFNITKISSLVDDKGNVYSNPNWDGSGPGGHHREGILTFNSVLSETKFVELIIKNVAGVAERKLKWNL